MNEPIPDWALEHKRKGTQITRVNNNYYLYKVTSKWNPDKKRSQKITEEYLGAITKGGLVPPKHKRMEEHYKHIACKEFGATYFLQTISQDILDELKKTFPYEWKELFTLAVFRLTEKSTIKMIQFHYQNSFLSETIKGTRASSKFLGPFLRDVGVRRESIKQFMRSFLIDTEYAIIDITNIFSYAEGMLSAVLGHNKNRLYLPQINLILLYSLDKQQPAYFRQIPGSVRDVSAIVKTVNEIPKDKFVMIGDKGFYSEGNVKALKDNDIQYVIALKRNSTLINYAKIQRGNRKDFDGYFLYNNRTIWYYARKLNNEAVITYLDQSLKAEEESDLGRRIQELENKERLTDKERDRLKKYKHRLLDIPERNGTLSIITNIGKSCEEAYQIMKSRVNVEQAFDMFKNVLEGDRSYMRTDKQLEGWLFVNLIAMQMYYKIYAILLDKKMLNNNSPIDVLTHLKRVYKLKAGDKWQIAEVPKKSREIIKKIRIDIPI